MSAEAFFDTNVVIYALATNDPRAAQAEELLAGGGKVSVQVLNEFAAVARRKMQMTWPEVSDALAAIRVLCPSPIAITVATHEVAVKIAENYEVGIFDALIAAAALQAGCQILYSEDLQDGLVIERKVTVRNPFA